MNAPAVVAVPPAVVTDTFAAPAGPAGVVTVNDVAEFAVIDPAAPANVADVAPDRFVPVIVTLVPPDVGPDEGETDVMVGADAGAAKVKVPTSTLNPPLNVTDTLTIPETPGGAVRFHFLSSKGSCERERPDTPPNFTDWTVPEPNLNVGAMFGTETVIATGVPAGPESTLFAALTPGAMTCSVLDPVT